MSNSYILPVIGFEVKLLVSFTISSFLPFVYSIVGKLSLFFLFCHATTDVARSVAPFRIRREREDLRSYNTPIRDMLLILLI